jgi:hypothetical protein
VDNISINSLLCKALNAFRTLVERQFFVLLLFVLHHYGQRATGEEAVAAQEDGGATFH